MSVGEKPTDEGDNVHRSLQRSSEVLTRRVIIDGVGDDIQHRQFHQWANGRPVKAL